MDKRANLGAHALKGVPKSEEHKAKIAAALRGRIFTAEHCSRISASKIGKHRGRKTTPSNAWAAHRRLEHLRGRAAEYDCVDCGSPARDWSYVEPAGWSLDPSDYVPRCSTCHKGYDSRALREAYARLKELEPAWRPTNEGATNGNRSR